MRKLWQNHPAWCVFGAALLVFLFGEYSREVLMIDTRFGLFVKEMAENGIGPYPQLYGKWYPDYNFFPTFLSYLASRLFGINQFSLAFPSALAAAATLAWFHHFCGRNFSENFAAAATCFALASLEFLNICRITSIDLYPALAAWLGFVCAWESGKTGRRRKLFYVPLLYAFGYLARGPIGVVMVAVPVCSALMVRRGWKNFADTAVCGALAAGIMALGGALWLTLAQRCGGQELVRLVLDMQITGRLSKGKPFWYYFTNAAGSYAPLFAAGYAMMALWIIRMKKRLFLRPADETERLLQALLLWAAVFLGGMSIPGTKHLRYVVSLVPVMAFFAAQIAEPLKPEFELPAGIRKRLEKILDLLPLLMIAALLVFQTFVLLPPVAGRVTQRMIYTLIFVPLLLILHFKGKSPWLKLAAFCVVLQIGIIESVTASTQSSVRFVQAAEKFRNPGEAVTFFALGPDGDENKYMFHVNRDRIFIPRYASNAKQLAALPPGTLVATRRDHWEKRVAETERRNYAELCFGRLGHRKALFLRKKRK